MSTSQQGGQSNTWILAEMCRLDVLDGLLLRQISLCPHDTLALYNGTEKQSLLESSPSPCCKFGLDIESKHRLFIDNLQLNCCCQFDEANCY